MSSAGRAYQDRDSGAAVHQPGPGGRGAAEAGIHPGGALARTTGSMPRHSAAWSRPSHAAAVARDYGGPKA